MLRRCWIATFVILQALGIGAQPSSNRLRPKLEPLRVAVERLVRSYYPKALVTLQGEKIHFEWNTRKFMIHEPLLTGEWQDAHEESGPQKGGILGDLELRSGVYLGQAMVPQSFDKRYFILLVMAPYDSAHDAHLYVHLEYPRDASPRFLDDFRALVNRWSDLPRTKPVGQPPN